MTETQLEILKAVENINYGYSDHDNKFLEDNPGFFLTYSSMGFFECVKLGEFYLWDSENEGREFNEEKNEYEPIEQFLIKKMKEIIVNFKKFGTILNKIKTK